jgi:CoA:oxalate CoA-transferase
MADKPLEGFRVVDLTQIYQGPYAAFLMAMAGAEVVKVEPRAGERMRGAGGSRTPMAFAMLNSNKKSVTLDLKAAKGIQLLKDLVAKADVLLENFALGTMDRLGVGWEVLREVNPGLVYVSGTGYGLSGPDRDLLAMDHTIQAASGIMSVTGDDDRPPSRAGGAPCDIMGGVHMYAGTLSALLGRARTGKGTRVEISMLESMYFTLCSELTNLHANGAIAERNSARSPATACPYGRYRCSDGWIAIISVSESHWRSIAAVIGRDDLHDNPEFASAGKRRRVEGQVNAMIEAWSAPLSRDEAYQCLRDARVPVAPIRDLEEIRTDPHLHERGMLSYMTHQDLGEIVLPGSPIRYSDFDSAAVQFFPDAGAHNHSVYSEWLGLEAADIDRLGAEEVI